MNEFFDDFDPEIDEPETDEIDPEETIYETLFEMAGRE